MSLGSRLRVRRESMGKTQLEAANSLGISNVQLSRYEANERKPDPELLAKLAAFYKTSSDYLLGLTDDPSIHNKESEEDNFSVAFLGGGKEVLDEEEAEHLERELEMFRAFREKRRKEREGNNKK